MLFFVLKFNNYFANLLTSILKIHVLKTIRIIDNALKINQEKQCPCYY